MKEIVDITVNMNSKAIVVTYFDNETGITYKEGYDPTNIENWEFVENDEVLNEYKNIAWKGFSKPVIEHSEN